MVLTVPFEEFAAAAERLKMPKEAYLSRFGAICRVTCGDPDRDLLLRTDAGLTITETRKRLERTGFECSEGLWSSEAEAEAMPSASYWIAAVAYKGEGNKPGLWVDALPHRPLVGDILKVMYEEFKGQGELDGVDFEEFIRHLDPNVVILDPNEQDQFVVRHISC
jgi:hypothetical protein